MKAGLMAPPHNPALRCLLLLVPIYVLLSIPGPAAAAPTCIRWAPTTRWDTCSSVAVTNGLSLSTLRHLNPALDCSSLPSRVCTAAKGVKLPPACGKYDEVATDKHGGVADSCTRIATRHAIPDIHLLLALNPHLDCAHLRAGDLVCVMPQSAVEAHDRCIEWQEIEGDGVTDPCTTLPADINPHLPCGQPLPRGARVSGCTRRVPVPLVRAVCTRHEFVTSDGNTNYCFRNGGPDNEEAMVRHLQLNPHLYCGKGSPGGNVMLCAEGYTLDAAHDPEAAGSPVRDHLMLKLLRKLTTSPRLPPLNADIPTSPFDDTPRGPPGTDHTFLHAARHLPGGFMDSAAALVQMAGAAVRQYKAGGSQVMAHAAWGALMKALTRQDFSPDLFDLQAKDKEFATYVDTLLVTHKRDVMCETMTPAAARRPALLPAARCLCDPSQHILRCQMLVSSALTVLQRDHPINPGDDAHPAGDHHGHHDDSHPATITRSTLTPTKPPATFKDKDDTSSESTMESTILDAGTVDEFAAYRAAGADPELGVMRAQELEEYHYGTNMSTGTGGRRRGVLQAGTDGSKQVVDSKILTGTDAILKVKNEACKKVKQAIDDGIDDLRQALATCTVQYNNADFCGGALTCLSVGCPAVDFQIVNIRLTGTLCLAIPRDVWLKCRAACWAMERGYEAIGDPTSLNCPTACIRYIGDPWLQQKVAIAVDVCLGGSAVNLIKWLDDVVPDFVEKALGINWSKLLCINLINGGLAFTTGLFYVDVSPDLIILKVSLAFTLQVYRPWNYPEVCDCNASPWACQPFCLKKPGGITFQGYIRVGVKIDLPWPLPDFDLSKTWSWSSGFPPCPCPALPPKLDSLCSSPSGILLPSTSCAKCPAGMIAPGGGACIACPAGSIPNTAGNNCLYCATGFISPLRGGTACVKCTPPLTSSPSVGGRVCYGKCPPGTQNTGTRCDSCAPGTFNPGTSTTGTCQKCPKGSVAATSKSSSCQECGPGTAATSEGLSSCSTCPAGSVPSQCSCRVYHWLDAPSLVTFGTATLARLQTVLAKGPNEAAITPLTTNRLVSSLLTTSSSRANFFVGTSGNSLVLSNKVAASALRVGDWSRLFCRQGYGCKACDTCPPGTYSRPGDTSCTPCKPGYYQPKSGQSSCLPCPQGTASPSEGAISCPTCAAGTYATGCRPAFVFDLPVFKSFVLPKRNYRLAFAGETLARRRLAQVSAEEIAELEGQWVVEEGGSGKLVPAARAAGRQLQQANAAFRFPFVFSLVASKQLLPTVVGCTECRKCDPGTVSATAGKTTCTVCTAGYYQNLEGQSSCQPCTPGTASTYPGAFSCTPCPNSTYPSCANITTTSPVSLTFLPQLSFNTRAILCGAGYTADTCALCPAGSATSNTGRKECKVPCDAGYYRPGANFTCLPCAPGTFSNGTNAVSCTGLCPAGTYAANWGTASAANCTKCPANTFSTAVGATSQSTCVKCPAGQISFPGATGCITVPRIPIVRTPIPRIP